MKKQDGFTLMEMVVAVAVVGILALVAYTVIYFNFDVINSVTNSTNSRWEIRDTLQKMRNDIQDMQVTQPGNSGDDHGNEDDDDDHDHGNGNDDDHGNGNGNDDDHGNGNNNDDHGDDDDDHGNGHDDDEDGDHGNDNENGSDNSASVFTPSMLRFTKSDGVQITYQIQGNSTIRRRTDRDEWVVVAEGLQDAEFSYFDAGLSETNQKNDIRFIRIELKSQSGGKLSSIEETIYVRNEGTATGSTGSDDDHDSDDDHHSGRDRD
jgi:prepilin-type N-terminal cleavage/methylation domain-containing protein